MQTTPSSYSSIAVRGVVKDRLLKAVGFAETSAVVKVSSGASQLSCTDWPGGWTILDSDDFAWAH